ncbi:MFS transporter [Silvibacterium dinghuense]|uniref:MFS transporter n=1 Tax=Silvibacterium dinghuense TaxID=1560006 RepID=A0A4Q1SK71_9BACT|nr:MFS transporter [Silvibacterium dinghuense]RXS97849.1 MFS transporter [Silvibacterium dinghuense]GGH02480.1 MFS transporter [Silvibacterium dinghuense]
MRENAAKWALAALFLIDGFGFGLWAVHVPVFKQRLALGNGELSLVLFGLVLGSIVSMPLVGQLIARIGSRTVARVVALSYGLILAAMGMVDSFVMLVVCAVLYGAAKGAFDVTVNTQAIAVERHFGKSIMSPLQGCWSLGGLLGAGASSLSLRHGASLLLDLGGGGLLMVAATLLALPWLIQEPAEERAAAANEGRFRLPDTGTLRLAVIAFFGLFAEGAVGDWAAVFLRSNLGVSLSLAAAGYATYAVAMAGARFSGHWLLRWLSPAQALAASGGLLALGFGATVTLHHWAAALVGLVLTGFGMANIVPVVFTAVARTTKIGAGPAISAVSTVGYFGFLAGPPLIGWVAVHIGLEKALGLVVLSGVAVAFGPLLMARQPDREREQDAVPVA